LILGGFKMKNILYGSTARRRIFQCKAVTFDGTNDYMARGADLTGNADSKVGTISFWFRTAVDGTNIVIHDTKTTTMFIRKLTTNKFAISASNAALATILNMVSGNAFTTSATWHHLAASWNLATPVAHLYIDGASDEAAGSTETNDTIDYTRTDHFIGSADGFSSLYNGDLAELYINYAAYIDITQAANLQKLRSASGKPVDLGVDGSLPTGTAPIIYQSVRSGDAATVFAINKGSGGNFTITGALAIAATSPSD